MKWPYFKIFPLDWLRDTGKLSPAAKGHWITILCYAWNEPRCGVYRRDLEALQREIRIGPHELKEVLSELSTVATVKFPQENVVEIVSRQMVKNAKERKMNAGYQSRYRERVRAMLDESKGHSKGEVRAMLDESKGDNLALIGVDFSSKTSRKDKDICDPPPKRSPKTFSKPTPSDVTAYAKSLGFELDGERFCDFYESKGWVVGKSPMKDWKAAVRTWKRSVTANGGADKGGMAWMHQ